MATAGMGRVWTVLSEGFVTGQASWEGILPGDKLKAAFIKALDGIIYQVAFIHGHYIGNIG
jgi:hypothetical protein